MKPIVRGLVVLAMVSGAASAQRANPRTVQPERPTVATHAYPVAKGYAELEWGMEMSDAVTQFPLYLKAGLSKTMQLGVMVPPFKPDGGDFDIGNTSINLKWKLSDNVGSLGAFAIQPGVTLPNGGGDAFFNVWLITSRSLGAVGLDLNANITTQDGNTFDTWAASFGGAFTDKLGWVFEVFGQPNVGSNMNILVGPTLRLRNSFALDAGLIQSLESGGGMRYYFGGVTNFGKLTGGR